MGNSWKKAGLIGLGAVLGVLLSLNFSAVAQREARLPIPYEDLQLLAAVFGRIKSDYVETVPDEKLIKEAINGMVHGLDPHSDFLDADAFKEMQVSTQGKFGGLGIEVGVEDGVVRVISPIEDTPAFRAGIKSGDLIVKIDDMATRGVPLSKAVEKMRGKPGTDVVLTVFRKDAEAPLTFTLTREEINVKSVRAKMVEPGYGYIRVRQFQDRTGEDLAKAVKEFYKAGELKGLVLDVRSDPGGLLNQAVAVSAAFLPKDALVVYTDGRTPDAKMRLLARREDYSRRGEDYFRDLPGRGEEGADGGAGRRRHGVGVGDRGRRAAGPQAGHRDRRADLRQGLGADDPAARQQRRPQADDGALLHAVGPLDPGQGHRAGHRVDDGRDSPNRIREANLDRHLETGKAAPPSPMMPRRRGRQGGRRRRRHKVEAPPRLPRFEFGAADDFQLQQAMNHLKGQPVIASTKVVAAQAKSAVTAEPGCTRRPALPGVLLARGIFPAASRRTRTTHGRRPTAPLQPPHPARRSSAPDAQERFAAAHALVVGVGGLGAPARSSWRRRAWARSRSATPTPSTSPTCSDRSSTRPPTSARRKVDAAARRLAAVNPEVRIERIARARRRRRTRAAGRAAPTSCSTAATTSRRATRSTPRASPRGKPAGLGRRAALRRPDRGVRSARPARAVLPLPVRRGRGARGNAVRDDGRVRAARRHRRRDAGCRGAEAHRRRRRRRSPADCCCSTRSRCSGAKLQRAARSRLSRLRGASR